MSVRTALFASCVWAPLFFGYDLAMSEDLVSISGFPRLVTIAAGGTITCLGLLCAWYIGSLLRVLALFPMATIVNFVALAALTMWLGTTWTSASLGSLIILQASWPLSFLLGWQHRMRVS